MNMIVVSVRDAKAEMFLRPWFVQTTGIAVRAFTDEVNRVDISNPIYTHPTDFSLYELGTFNDNSGRFESHEVPKLLCYGDQVSTKVRATSDDAQK